VLTFACSAVALVVGYSCLLAGFLRTGPAEGTAEWQDVQEARWLDSQIRTALSYNDLRIAVGDFLISERCTFSEAMGLLLQGKTSHSPKRLQILRLLYPGYSDEECLAANLLESVVYSLRQHHRARLIVVARRLEADFQAYYGKPVPERVGFQEVLKGVSESSPSYRRSVQEEAPGSPGD
jgi:hypothetical protein